MWFNVIEILNYTSFYISIVWFDFVKYTNEGCFPSHINNVKKLKVYIVYIIISLLLLFLFIIDIVVAAAAVKILVLLNTDKSNSS